VTTVDRTDYRLADRYAVDDGRVFLSGSQALARVAVEQLRADRRAGWRTAAFVSGYPGSPLANFDRDAAAAARQAELDGLQMVVQPGLNEELAATSVMGSQLASTRPNATVEGVIGIWYGKGPGIDRASDALRHAVFAGTSARGGAVAYVGDDPKAKSSTIPSSSDATLVDLHIPFMYPGDVQEAIDLGRHAVAMSRASGLWTGMKIVDAVADGSGTVELAPDRITPVMPVWEVDGRPWMPTPSGRLLTPYTLDAEREFHEIRLPVAKLYAAANHLNSIRVHGPNDWIGLAACGYTYREMLDSLRLLGLSDADALRAAGVRLLKLDMPVPLDAELVRRFADGLTEIVVVEEKNPTLEWLVKDALYGTTNRPMVHGKTAPDGTTLVPTTGALDVDNIAAALRLRLQTRLADRLRPAPATPRQLIPLTVTRTPYFCSGCPHNTSTKVPDGAVVGGGIGCHSMVMFQEEDRVGDIVGLTAMGNEGAQWIGMSHFVETDHLIQNIGDGTLFHSGLLAVRAARASGVNITYKILYNGAVAMTGGQDPQGQLDVPHLVQALLAEGVQRIIVTTDDLLRYRPGTLPEGVPAWGRSRLIEAQQELAKVPGCTVLIHDQRCAAEKRRDRKRAKLADPGFRVVINERVCEGCGDCGDQSNCLSVQPVDTPFGRKTRIDQASCNLDLTCLQGDCPSFMLVATGDQRNAVSSSRSTAAAVAAAAPAVGDATVHPLGDGFTLRMAGIGGTGVVTVSQVIGTAAMLDGLHVRGLDQTGLSQKAGPVVSDLRILRHVPQGSNRVSSGEVDVLLAFDQLTAAQDAQLAGASADRTVALVNAAQIPTGAMVIHPDRAFPGGEVADRLVQRTATQHHIDAGRLVPALIGDEATSNVFMVGAAAQLGLLPVTVESLRRAITLNGVSVDKNLRAFEWGRAAVADADGTRLAAGMPPGIGAGVWGAAGSAGEESVDALIDRLADDLRGYQSARYANRFRTSLAPILAVGDDDLSATAARSLHKLMAYKDEYEVARLLLMPSSAAAAAAAVAGQPSGRRHRVKHLLHPPALRSMGMRRKLRLGLTARPTFVVLRALRRLRGTPFDAFGWASLRRIERAMIPEFEQALATLAERVGTAGNRPSGASTLSLAEARSIANLPDQVRGYEHLKRQRAVAYRAALAEALSPHGG
jgi:indolepyruvate ferredoxin oxidoreductase